MKLFYKKNSTLSKVLCKKNDDKWETVISEANFEITDHVLKSEKLNIQLICEERPEDTIYAPILTSHEETDDPYEIVWRQSVTCGDYKPGHYKERILKIQMG